MNKNILQKYGKPLIAALVAAVLAVPLAQAAADFNPNQLIEDSQFSDTQTFGSAAGIQQFLVAKKSVLANTDPSFLQKLREPQDVAVKTALNDPEPNLGRLRSASELIWDASVKAQINPQVVIVTLQKEESLITGQFDPSGLQRALDHALGFGCPDSGGCDAVFFGFYNQLFGGFDSQGNKYIGGPGSLMRSFQTPGGRGPAVDAQNDAFGGNSVRTSKVGDTIKLQNTLGSVPNIQAVQAVTLSNLSTAALYRYTPHVYNGNYNFWKYFNLWFRYPNGTLIKLSSSEDVYIINNGLRSLIPVFVINQRGLNAYSAIVLSPTEFSSIDQGPILGPADNTIIRDQTGKLYVFVNNEKHPASDFVLKQRGLNPASAVVVTQTDADLFQTAAQLTPKDGTLIKGDASPTVYVIHNQKRNVLTGFTFKQYGYSFKNVVTLPQAEVDSYDSAGFLLPKEGTLVKTKDSPQVFLVQNQLLRPISGDVFKMYGYSFANVNTLDIGELAAAGLGSFVQPPEGTYFKTPDNTVYLYKGNAKHYVSYFVFRQYRPSVVDLSSGEAQTIPDGLPLTPKDGTLIKGDQSPAIYVMENGLKNALDYSTWVQKYGRRAPSVLSQAEVDSYPAPGDIEQ
ncbi:hypothetical protein KGQ24_03045 [Patescibacteria group bacterium]|nr:hypothetical protein [Patescibacteria group bacterium]